VSPRGGWTHNTRTATVLPQFSMTPTLLRVSRITEVLATFPGEPRSWLSPSEQTRLQRLQIASRRDQYLSGHWLVRCLLAEQYGGNPEDWLLQERPSLPPAVTGHEDDIHLSLSHSADWIACAISNAPIGIDIEQRQPPREALHRFEHLLLAEGDLPGTLNTDELLQRWVVKEAWIKRHHGSALPEHLAALKSRRVDPRQANVRLLVSEFVFFGIAADDDGTGSTRHALFDDGIDGWRVEG
jgi:4'-phosphopantetheinyl transferase